MLGLGDPVAVPARDGDEARHLPALDGLRGLAVLGVLAFHGGYLTGGYLGVDLFFVLSGFLITGLLLREHARRGTNDLGEFWRRRGRRLLPALFGLLVGVALYARFVAAPFEWPGIRGDTVWTLLYAANWHAIWSGNGYWQLFDAPSPLEHTWSLAIEEQFYVVWPLVFYGLVRVTRGRHGIIAAVCGVLAALSAGWALVLFARTGDASRVYLGTDTRAAAILAGSCLAAVLVWKGPVTSHRARVALEVVAIGAVLMLGVAWATVPGESTVLYRGLLPACGLAVVAVIAAASHPRPGAVARALSWRPLRLVGLISYGLYLWHWPVFVWFRRDGILDGWARLAAEVAISFALAILSYLVIERPIRRGGVASWRWPVLVPAAATAAVLLLFVATIGGVDRGIDAATASPTGGIDPSATMPTLPPFPDGTAAPGPGPAPAPAPAIVPSTIPLVQTANAAAVTGPMARAEGRASRLLVVGDSVAWFVARTLDREATANGIVVGQRAAPSCALYNGETGEALFREAVDNEDPRCQPWRSGLAQDARSFRPDATLVLFGGAVFGQRRVGGEWHGFCDPEYRAAYRSHLDGVVDDLSSTGGLVYLALAPEPTFAFLPEESAAFNDCMNREMLDVAGARPSVVRVIRLDEWTCPPGQGCREHQDGVTLREDGIHFDEGAGADIVTPWLISQIFEPR